MRRSLLFLFLASCFIFAGPAWSYDQALAASYETHFSAFAGKGTPKSLQMIPSKAFVEALKKGEEMLVIDIRTAGETGVFGLNLTNSLSMSMDQVFKPENLARIPSDKKVVIVCKAGHRAMAVATALRHVGFKNVFTLKHGIEDLARFLSPKTAY
jgi:rhodanese-related sulfurtransferase